MSRTHEKHESLWMLTLSPSIWAAHFVLSYATAAIWCAKVVGPGGSLTTVRIAITVYTVVSLIGIAIVGRIGHVRYSHGGSELPDERDTPEDRHRFLGFATVLLSGLSAVAVLYGGLVAIFFGTCH